MTQKKFIPQTYTKDDQDSQFQSFLKNITFEANKQKIGWTNAVLVQIAQPKSQNMKKNVQIFIPGYLRLKVKNFVSIALSDMNSTLNCTILFTIYYGNLPKPIVNALKNKFVLNLIRNQSITLKSDSQDSEQSGNPNCQIIENQFQSTIEYKIRKQVDLSFFPHISSEKHVLHECMSQFDNSLWYSPFQIIDQVLTIQIPRIIIYKEDFDNNCKCNQNKNEKDPKNKNNNQNIENKNSKNSNSQQTNDNNISHWSKFIKALIPDYSEEGKQNQIINHIGVSINLMDIPNQVLLQQHNAWISRIQKQDKSKFIKQKLRQFRPDDCQKLDIRKQPILGIYGLASKKVKAYYSNNNYSKIYQQQKSKTQTSYTSIENEEKLGTQPILMYQNKFDSDKNQQCHTQRCLRTSLDTLGTSRTVSQKRKVEIARAIFYKKTKRQISTQREHQKSFLNAHFIIPVYKFPGVSIVTIFFPLWLLAILNLAIYFQSTTFDNRTVSIGTLIIAYVALIPVIRSQIPPYSGVLMVQILVYSQTFTNLFCLLESFWFRYDNKSALNINEVGPFLYISLSISLFSVLVILFLYILHKTRWQKDYAYQKNSKYKTTAQYCKPKKCNILHWQNQKCDQFFYKKNKKILLLNDLFPEVNTCHSQDKRKSAQNFSSPLSSLKFQSRTSLQNNFNSKQNLNIQN